MYAAGLLGKRVYKFCQVKRVYVPYISKQKIKNSFKA